MGGAAGAGGQDAHSPTLPLPPPPASCLSAFPAFPAFSPPFPPLLPLPPLPAYPAPPAPPARLNVACNPIAPPTNPASASNGEIGCCAGGAPSISSISMPRGESPPVRARSISTRATARPTLRSIRLGVGQERDSWRSPRAQIRGERAVDENDRGADRTRGSAPCLAGDPPEAAERADRNHCRRALRALRFCRARPLQRRAVGIRRIGRGEHRDLRDRPALPQRSQQIERAGQGELRRAEARRRNSRGGCGRSPPGL